MAQQASNIVIAVDAELHVLERRVAQLREINRLALELDTARLPSSASHPAAERPRRQRASGQPAPLTAADAIDAARDLLADGPTTIGKILDQLGRSPAPRSRAAVQDALEQLGASVAGRARGGGDLYALAAESDNASARNDEELVAKVRELAESAVGWSDEELQYQLRKRCGLQAPLDAVRHARRELNGTPA
jgi:hypothetical protein